MHKSFVVVRARVTLFAAVTFRVYHGPRGARRAFRDGVDFAVLSDSAHSARCRIIAPYRALRPGRARMARCRRNRVLVVTQGTGLTPGARRRSESPSGALCTC